MSPIAAGDSRFPGLTARYRLVAPLYLGGAAQQPELRAASLKGVLRYWYRAVDPLATDAGGTREALLFGGGGEEAQQALALVRVHWTRVDGAKPPATWRWNREGVMREFTEGAGSRGKNGFVYLGWPFHTTRQTPRDAFAPGSQIDVTVVFPRWRTSRKLSTGEQRLWRGLLASLWMLGRVGSMGSRARRGFGGLELQQIIPFGSLASDWREDIETLRAGPAPNAAAWKQQIESGRRAIGEWLDSDFKGYRHPHLGPRLRVAILPRAHTGHDGWRRALNEAGRRLQDFRQRRQPDYDTVKRYLLDRERGGRADPPAPQRAAFGLPLAFQYGSLRNRVQRNSVTFVPGGARRGDGNAANAGRPRAAKPSDRHGSLLHVRLVQLADGVHSAFVRLDGEVPGEAGVRVRGGGDGRTDAAPGKILDDFMTWVAQ